MRQCQKHNDYCSIFEEDPALNVRVKWVRKNDNFATWFMHMFVRAVRARLAPNHNLWSPEAVYS